MGIPTYLKHILKNYPNIYRGQVSHIDHLYIDFNAMIYGVVAVLDYKKFSSYFQYENQLISDTIKSLEYVIKDVVKPQKSVYIAMDGPAPIAKIAQQRARRYKTIKDQQFIRELEEKYQTKIERNNWSKSSISPGTIFMSKLSGSIIRAIKSNNFTVNNNFKVIFSDDSVPGEGEHKLLDSLKQNYESDEIFSVFSPDADLIVQTLLTEIKNIYIVRQKLDENDAPIKDQYIYLDIGECRNSFFNELEKNDYKKVIRDYVFLTFLCGNDFVRSNHFLKIKEGGLDMLLDIYKGLYEDEYLVNDDFTINYTAFRALINQLAELEIPKLQKWQKRRDIVRNGGRIPSINKDDPKWKQDYKLYEHEEFFSPFHPHHKKYNHLFNHINYFSDEWVSQYNKFFFQEENIDRVCHEYLKSLQFCLYYYFKQIPAWRWAYEYRNSPTIYDLKNYLNNNENIEINFDLNKPLRPLEQLTLILPIQSKYLLPSSLLGIHNDPFFVKFYNLDMVQGGKYIYSEPILPDITDEILEKIEKNTDQAKLTAQEQTRNKIKNNPYLKIINA